MFYESAVKFANQVYQTVKDEFEGFDAIYEDAIVDLVGRSGLIVLQMHGYLETCGVINGRQLYVLVDKEA